MKKLISILLCVCMVFALAVTAMAAVDSATVEKTIKAMGVMSGDDKGNMNLSQTVTRAQFAKMMVAASTYKDTVEDGSGYSPFKDVKSTHWAAGYIKAAVDAKWMTGYVDGTFRPDYTITYEEAASAILRMLGYTSSDLSGTYPSAHLMKFRSLKLDSGISPTQGKALTRNECMYIFYNLMGAQTKSGVLYGTTLGYKMNSSDEIDYDELVKADIEGPYVLQGALTNLLPFDGSKATVYRNNNPATAYAVAKYDVVYYNTKTRTVWAYSDRAIGVMSAVSPSAVSPTSVTVAGVSYPLDTSTAKSKVSATGQFAIGDTVALLLGMDGTVADVISAAEVDSTYYGVVTKVELSTLSIDSSKSKADYILTVVCTDGVTRECTVNGNYYSAGNVVMFGYAKGELTVTRPGASSLSGKFSGDGKQLKDYKLAEDVQIMEVSDDGAWALLYPSRLGGIELKAGNVALYVMNAQQEITHLVLKDVTGDLYSYGVITSITETETASTTGGLGSAGGIYNYVIDGKDGTLTSTNTRYNVSIGGAIFYYKNGKIDKMKNLSSVSLSELTTLTATGNNKKFSVSDNVQAYLKSGNSYGTVGISALNADEYTLTGYYETSFPAGGQIRVIVAVKK